MKKKIWGKRVLLPDGWSSNTLIDIDKNGIIKDIKKNVQPSNQVFDTLIPLSTTNFFFCLIKLQEE